MTAPSAIEVQDLVKTYAVRGRPPVRALDGVSFDAPSGAVLGLLGPNGAGKSTTLKILTTLTRPDAGSARVAGVDVVARPAEVRRRIGYVAQRPVTDPMDTGRENLVLAGRLQGLGARAARARADELLERFDLGAAADRLVRTYSGGMARKLDVAVGLVHRPEVLFLDEPTTGLDPHARAEMWAEIERMTHEERMTVVLTTHYLEEADRLAAHLVIVDHGRVVAGGAPSDLKDALRGDTVVVEVADDGATARAGEVASRVTGLREVTTDGRTVRARTSASSAVVLPALLAALDAADVGVASATLARPSLDDVYLSITGRAFEAGAAAETEEVAA
ncbi:MAG TPA: ATP-binding cassette domain-containing protein [Actinotalea caeni]|uniref:ATP-binding cassette domain-containing protein n=1 Tax=Actinotalea caeni TaxID=1348467 RepID=UPI002B4AC99C|nr:ATP-binding cassette domain-containing protein [Actinotalea caeni]HLV56797.1 ATP-binding cassette domain-containing protein [Actinotalea caeni]